MTLSGFSCKPRALVAATLVLVGVACGGKKADDAFAPGRPADTILLDRGKKALEEKHWEEARGYFQQLLDTYPRSQIAGDARLGVADSYFYQRGSGNMVLAIAEYRDFLTFFPNHPRADYAQFQIGFGYYKQTHSADRDQEPTRTAIEEFKKLTELYRNSLYAEEGRKLLQECVERLAEHEFLVGRFYLKTRRWCRGAIHRFQGLIQEYPTYGKIDEVYFHLAEAHVLCNNPTEALPYFKQVVDNYPESPFREEAEQRLNELQKLQTSGL